MRGLQAYLIQMSLKKTVLTLAILWPSGNWNFLICYGSWAAKLSVIFQFEVF